MTTGIRPDHNESEDKYRERWKWDRVTWGCHAVDCYPGGCPWRVYSRDGKIVREEQSGTFPTIEPGMVKWLHFAGGYGHLQYRGIHWQPIPIDRAVHVDVRKA